MISHYKKRNDEVITYSSKTDEIATLPSVARDDKTGLYDTHPFKVRDK